ncbi:hypothetical protein [uncultured Fibrobacter sp.]|uniref:hypothetical protein n=1 Tax=uncultured Fibrobacter sp. TaxID=261512 RepID=UPI0028046137|nr:hypothetical protein [uncultured Fibrobacter sp.]
MKRNVLQIILYAVFVLAFNTAFFMISGTNHTSSVWLCYVLLHLAYVVFVLTPIFEAKGKTAYISNLTTYSISLAFLGLEFILLILVLIIEAKNWDAINGANTVIVLLQVFFTSVFIIALAVNLFANDSIAKKQAIHDAENSFIKGFAAKLKYIESIVGDSKLKNKVNDLYSIAHSSPVKSSEIVQAQETAMNVDIDELEKSVDNQNFESSVALIEKITRELNKRNIILKANR